jgi:methyl-accepting chemotaxis protein
MTSPTPNTPAAAADRPSETRTAPLADAMALASIAEVCERAALGDLEARIVGIDDAHEAAPVCHAINRMLDMADSFVRESAAAMDSCGQGRFHRPILERGLKGAYRQSAAVINRAGVAMRESHEQVAFAARLAEENATAVTVVAAACEQLRASGAEISRQAGQAAALNEGAVAQAAAAVEAATALHEVGRTIGGIVALIEKVAGQTNLLALNATIEAARAGEHGRGFSVVATEVKELSRGTAKASGEISRELERMIASVSTVASLIDGVKDTLTRACDTADAIEASTREQVLATAEISNSIADVSRNTSLVSERIGLHGRDEGALPRH